MSPFESFFAGEFQRELELVVIPRDAMHQPEGGEPSWDRKAAWLLWCEREGINPDKAAPPALALTEDGY